jgi:hypothetical protein
VAKQQVAKEAGKDSQRWQSLALAQLVASIFIPSQ